MIFFKFLNIITSIQQASLAQVLLKGRKFIAFEGQLIFEENGQLQITTIDNQNETYTDEEYKQLLEGAPVQLTKGKLIIISSPTELHQLILGNLFAILHTFVKSKKLGKTYAAPLDVYLDKTNVYQPDILFISNNRKHIIQNFIQGAPDLVVEILSPETGKYDLNDKLAIYEKNDILEYWIIHPKKQEFSIYLNKNGKLLLEKRFSKKEQVHATAVKGFSLELAEIFED